MKDADIFSYKYGKNGKYYIIKRLDLPTEISKENNYIHVLFDSYHPIFSTEKKGACEFYDLVNVCKETEIRVTYMVTQKVLVIFLK